MKVALCFIISYEHILNKEQLWIDWIRPNKDIINVYFHYRDVTKIKSPWIKMYTMPPQLTKPTSYYDVVPAYMSILSYAYSQDINNVWFCLLTDSCVPIISPEKFRKLFLDHYQASIIKCKPAYWDITIHRRANLRLLTKEYWLANDPWFTLCRFHVNQCLTFSTIKKDVWRTVNSGGLANESIFAIMLKTFNELTNPLRMINESATICDWSHMSSPTSPNHFKEATEENINIINALLKENKYAMFLRKVHRDFPEDTIKMFMNKEYNHTYDVCHNRAKNHTKTRREDIYRYTIVVFCGLLLVWLYFVL
jgi:hypothetical protein